MKYLVNFEIKAQGFSEIVEAGRQKRSARQSELSI